MFEVDEKPRRAILLAVQQQGVTDDELERSLAELKQMAKTLGITTIDSLTQKRGSFDPTAYLGPGKREELKQMVGDAAAPNAEVLLIEHEISPSQMRNLEKETGCEVLDRTQVILEIFHRHARSRAAKAQVEIVRLQYQAPRMRESSRGQDRQRGGIGGKGAGESTMELDRRKIRDRITELKGEIEAMAAEQQTQRARRNEQARAGGELQRVALVGYTNAGKSSWMRALTGSEVYVADKLFATLDTTVRTLQPEGVPRILVSDTVGFIRNLPHGLVTSFKSTLDEALEASLLVHVIDLADPDWERQLGVTESVLAEIGAGEVERLLLFNKIDKLVDQAATIAAVKERYPDAVFGSALDAASVDDVRQRLQAHFTAALVEAELRLGWDQQKLRGEIFASCQVVGERAEDDGAYFQVRASEATLARLRSLLGAN